MGGFSPEARMRLGSAAKLLSSSSSSSTSSSSSVSSGTGRVVGVCELASSNVEVAWRTMISRDNGLSDCIEVMSVVGRDMFLFSSSHLTEEGGLQLASSPNNFPRGDHIPRFSPLCDCDEGEQ
jgi:hypothetical protein